MYEIAVKIKKTREKKDREREREIENISRGQIEAEQSRLKIDEAPAKLSISKLIKGNDTQLR